MKCEVECDMICFLLRFLMINMFPMMQSFPIRIILGFNASLVLIYSEEKYSFERN